MGRESHPARADIGCNGSGLTLCLEAKASLSAVSRFSGARRALHSSGIGELLHILEPKNNINNKKLRKLGKSLFFIPFKPPKLGVIGSQSATGSHGSVPPEFRALELVNF